MGSQSETLRGWTKSCTTLKPWFVGIDRGMIVPGFFRWVEMDVAHLQNAGIQAGDGVSGPKYPNRPLDPCV